MIRISTLRIFPISESFLLKFLSLKLRALGTYLEPQTTIYKWMFGETTIFYVKIWNHPIETTIYKWLFGVPGSSWYLKIAAQSPAFPFFGKLAFCGLFFSCFRWQCCMHLKILHGQTPKKFDIDIVIIVQRKQVSSYLI